jgi:hypothetical protein
MPAHPQPTGVLHAQTIERGAMTAIVRGGPTKQQQDESLYLEAQPGRGPSMTKSKARSACVAHACAATMGTTALTPPFSARLGMGAAVSIPSSTAALTARPWAASAVTSIQRIRVVSQAAFAVNTAGSAFQTDGVLFAACAILDACVAPMPQFGVWGWDFGEVGHTRSPVNDCVCAAWGVSCAPVCGCFTPPPRAYSFVQCRQQRGRWFLDPPLYPYPVESP